jgi:hypothetical protein
MTMGEGAVVSSCSFSLHPLQHISVGKKNLVYNFLALLQEMIKVDRHDLMTIFMRNQDFEVDGENSKLCALRGIFHLMRE